MKRFLAAVLALSAATVPTGAVGAGVVPTSPGTTASELMAGAGDERPLEPIGAPEPLPPGMSLAAVWERLDGQLTALVVHVAAAQTEDVRCGLLDEARRHREFLESLVENVLANREAYMRKLDVILRLHGSTDGKGVWFLGEEYPCRGRERLVAERTVLVAFGDALMTKERWLDLRGDE
ncbi:hypothetical protein [Sphingosinicella sp. BN140058]|uniref:hypothetical protein n=1 Tax=Sphingosinicella sp. BN140058 TaxID=1892855 RepID=UPI0010119BD1|nr:hypothetical protein [Sphingosinicella sp. BN140058]QAY80154.1 hypothetical protein ETR14_26285 [Sphingosinicella sp. BN140058]